MEIHLAQDSAGALNQGAWFPSFLVTVHVNDERGGGRQQQANVASDTMSVESSEYGWKKPNLTVTFLRVTRTSDLYFGGARVPCNTAS